MADNPGQEGSSTNTIDSSEANNSRAPTLARALTVDSEPKNPFRQFYTWTMPAEAGGLTLTGYSRAADKTFFYVPELKLALDAGLCEGIQPPTVFVTHTHIDHSMDITYLCQRAAGSVVYVPDEVTDYVTNYVRAEVELNNCDPYDEDRKTHTLVGVTDGDTFFFGKRDKYEARVFACHHAVPCVGYAVAERRTQLKAEYRGMPGKEIGALRKAGTEVSEAYTQPMFVYVGDTHISALQADENQFIFDYPVIIVECTFIQEDMYERADLVKHVHWRDLRPIVEANRDVTFVLIHFSYRTRPEEVAAFFLAEAEERAVDLSNVVVWSKADEASSPID